MGRHIGSQLLLIHVSLRELSRIRGNAKRRPAFLSQDLTSSPKNHYTSAQREITPRIHTNKMANPSRTDLCKTVLFSAVAIASFAIHQLASKLPSAAKQLPRTGVVYSDTYSGKGRSNALRWSFVRRNRERVWCETG